LITFFSLFFGKLTSANRLGPKANFFHYPY
jgi:hypothetical protein